MGGHYGSVQVRTADRAAVKAAAESAANAKKIHCLIGPEINGWVGVYPENNGQDDSVGREIAQRLQADVLHLLVHDDDVLAYWLWRNHELVDSYWSKPGYFGEENRANEERRKGDPEQFRPFIGDKANRMAAILDRENQPVFAYEQLAKLGKLLGINNAVTAYEYLKEGERDQIKGWRKFDEVPAAAIKAEAATKQNELAQVKAERKALQKAKLLLQSDDRPRQSPQACAAGDGFVVAWPDYFSPTVEINLCSPPFDRVEPALIESPAHITAVVSDTSGRRVAFAAGSCVRVWDVSPDCWRQTVDIPESDLAVGAGISSDGTCLIHASRKETIITRLPSGERLGALPISDHQSISIHPGNKWAAVAGNSFRLVKLEGVISQHQIYVGGKSESPAVVKKALQKKMAGIDVAALVEKLKAGHLARAGMMQSSEANAKEADIVNQHFETMLANLKGLQSGDTAGIPGLAPQANERVQCTGFSRDGNWIWCGTGLGIRIYEWSGFPREGGTAPLPKWKWDSIWTDPNQFDRQINAVVEEPNGSAIVFGGWGGELYRMNLQTGAVQRLIKLPGGGGICAMSFSRDGSALSVSSQYSRTFHRDSKRKDSMTWEVWDYARLLQSAEAIA